MLTKKDLKNISKIINGKIIKVLGDFWEDIAAPYLEKEFSSVNGRLDKVENRLDKVETDVRDIKRDVWDIKADMPTKEDFKNLKKLEEIHRKELGSYA